MLVCQNNSDIKKKLTRLSFLLLIKLCPSNFLLSMVLRCTKQFFSYVEITLDLTSCLTGRKNLKKGIVCRILQACAFQLISYCILLQVTLLRRTLLGSLYKIVRLQRLMSRGVFNTHNSYMYLPCALILAILTRVRHKSAVFTPVHNWQT